LTKFFLVFILNFAGGVDMKEGLVSRQDDCLKKQSGLPRKYRDLAPNKLSRFIGARFFIWYSLMVFRENKRKFDGKEVRVYV